MPTKVIAEWKIAQRLYFADENNPRSSRPAIKVALGGIILGVMVMLIAISVVVGFKQEVAKKVAGFGSHIQVVNFDNNSTYEMQPVRITDSLLNHLKSLPYVTGVSTFASKPGIIKTDSAFQGIIFKGTDYWEYFETNMVKGSLPSSVNDVLISSTLAQKLGIELEEQILCYFIEESLRVRKLRITGIYNTCLEEMDDKFILGHINLIRRLNGWEANQVSGIEVLVDDLHHLEQATDGVYFATANRLDQDGRAFYTQNLKQLNPQIFGWLNLLDMNVIIIILLMLSVSGFSIVTGLIILIMESVQLIGTMKALGADNQFVRRVFIYQALMLIGKGILWGNILGIGLCTIQYFTHMIPLEASSYYVSYVPIAFSWGWWILLNVGTLLISWGILLAPSAIITKISPARVMHFE